MAGFMGQAGGNPGPGPEHDHPAGGPSPALQVLSDLLSLLALEGELLRTLGPVCERLAVAGHHAQAQAILEGATTLRDAMTGAYDAALQSTLTPPAAAPADQEE